MNKKLRQEILNELKGLLEEQFDFKSFGGLSLSKDEKQQIMSSPAEIANFITTQNKNTYTNLDEAAFALEAIKTINDQSKASQFVEQWKKLNSTESIQLKGNFNEYGRNIQEQIKNFGQKIMQLSGAAPQQELSPTTKPPVSDQPEQSLVISCKRCKGVGKGCSGAVVKEVQDRLIKLGLIKQSHEEIQNQKFGDFTESIVIQFQRSKRLKDDGIVGSRTCIALGLMKPAAKKPTAAPKPVPKESDLDSDTEYKKVEESINFIDKKKLNEAKKLFNKLLENL